MTSENAATSWLATSPADYDRRLMMRGHKRNSADQGDLFYVATPNGRAEGRQA